MEKRFLYFANKAKFQAATQGTEYNFTSIVFIGDTKEIWNRGIYYGTPNDFDINDYLTKAEAEETYLKEHQDLSAYVKMEALQALIAGYYTKEEVDAAIEAIDVTDQLVEYAKTADVEAKIAELKGEVEETYATKTEMSTAVKDAIDGIVDGATEAMDTLKEVEEALSKNKTVVDALNEAIGSKASKEELAAVKSEIETALEDYAKTEDVDSKLEELKGEIEEADYASEDYVDGKVAELEAKVYTKEEVDEMWAWGEY